MTAEADMYGHGTELENAERLVDELRYFPESKERRADVLRLVGDLITACSRLRPVACAAEHAALVDAVMDLSRECDALRGALREIRDLLGPMVLDKRIDHLLRTFVSDQRVT